MWIPTRVIDSYVHERRIGVLVELGMESDFAARTKEVRAAIHDLALHIAAAQPEDIPALLKQTFVKDPEITVGDLVSNLASLLKERIQITRFIRWDTEFLEPQPTSEDPPRGPAVQMRLGSAKRRLTSQWSGRLRAARFGAAHRRVSRLVKNRVCKRGFSPGGPIYVDFRLQRSCGIARYRC